MSELNIIIGCDHGAYQLKDILVKRLVKDGLQVEDVGVSGPESVDYPDIGMQVASQVSQGKYPRGILLCGTGLGMSMVANRYPHVRAALCNDLFSAVLSRQHNNANILVMGGRVIGDVTEDAIGAENIGRAHTRQASSFTLDGWEIGGNLENGHVDVGVGEQLPERCAMP